MAHRDHRDGTIETLADSEAALLDRVVDLTLERDALKTMVSVLLTAFGDLEQRFKTQQERYHRVLNELREYRRRVA